MPTEKSLETVELALLHNPDTADKSLHSSRARKWADQSQWKVLPQSLSPSLELSNQTFTSEQLSEGRCICQVDKKFLLCLLPTSDGQTVVLVDQHAASERVRVETFLKELCLGYLGGDLSMTFLKPPRTIVLTEREGESLLKTAKGFFGTWGITFRDLSAKVAKPERKNGFVQLDVLTVPTILSDKVSV